MSFKCEHCDNAYVNKCHLTRHQKSEACIKIQNIIQRRDDMYKNKYDEFVTLIESIKKDNFNLNQKILELKKENTMNKDKAEEYRKIVENSTIFTNKTIATNLKSRDEIVSNEETDNTFHIDINVTETQLNKTKYKDVPEEIVKKNIKSLKLKDNYQLEYRETDGYIDVNDLCKAGGKEFRAWNRLNKTKRFLEVLSATVLISTVDLLKQEQGGNGERHTWSHPQVAVNIAQWISPEFDVLVSKWVYEIMLTGKVDIRDNKTTQELDKINIENKLPKNKLKLTQTKDLKKQPREKYDGKYFVYLATTDYKAAQGHYKCGKSINLQSRMSVYNTTDKHNVIYYVCCKDKKSMDILESLVHLKLDNCRIEPNREWFKSEEDAEDFIKIINECKQVNNL